MTRWYESDNPGTVVRGGTWRVMVLILVFLIFFGLIGIGLWAFGVFTSDVKGRGDAVKTKNSAVNRIAAQERFHDLYQDVVAADRRIDVMADALKRNPDSEVNQANLTGSIAYCIDAVAAYDAETQKYTKRDYLDYSLPQDRIDDTDPATDCKETAK